jgi:hypothetical protein
VKALLAGLIAGIILGTAGVAGAVTVAGTWTANGVMCKGGAGGVACLPLDGSRYGIGLSSQVVMVYDTKTSKTVWHRAN